MKKTLRFLLGMGIMYYAPVSGANAIKSPSWFDCAHHDALGMTSEDQQTTTITGTVRDANGVLPGVTISVKGKIAVSLSDNSGKFTITAEPTDILLFSFMGYKTLEVPLNNKAVINVEMKTDETSLQEVTVNAGYYKVKDKERTGSIAKITSKEIENQPITNFLGTMQGRMAGVNITQNNGISGSGFTIQIRGQNSIRADGNEPLYIIDGVPYSSEPIGNGISMQVMNALTSPLNNINPADVESIEVLKDADATAIYGSRGANGVVLITTKKGKKGKTRFNASFAQGTGRVANFMDLMDTPQYLAMRAEGFVNDGITGYPANAYDINGTWDQSRYTNWQEKFTGGTSKITNISASASGGSENTQFLVSTNFGSETTVFPGDFGYKKSSFRAGFNHASEDKKFKIGFSAGYNIQQNNQPGTDLTVASWTLAPNAPALYNEAGELNWEENTFDNPLALLNGKSASKTHDLVANATVSYELLPKVELRANAGYTDLNHNENTTSPSTIYNPSFGIGSESSNIFYTTTTRKSWIAEPQINWKPSFGAIDTDLLVGATFQQQENRLLGMGGYGFASNSLMANPAAASVSEVLTFDQSEYKYQSVFARANLKYKERYILNLTARRDGSSRFGPGNRFGWFGAVGVAWLFSEEAVLKDNKMVSFGKLRASYGTTGNDQIGNYKYLNTYAAGATGYETVIGLQPARLFNANFGWETNRKLELALETGFLKDRIFITAAWYRNRSSSQLVGVPLPGTTGFTEIQGNLDAVVENSGTEFTLRTINVETTNFSWTTSLNLSVAKNKLVSFPNLESSTYSTRYVIGQPLNIDKVYHYTGIDPETGLYTFEDLNGDGLITAAEDQTYTRDLNPSYFGGIQNQLRYKNWQLDFLFQFVKQDNYNVPASIGVPGTMINQPTMVLPHWQKAGDTGPYQIYTSGANANAVQALYNYAASDAAISDASYVRLKNLSVSYSLPQQWTGTSRCRLSLEAQNLFTITPYDGPDPEFSGIGKLPPLRIITAGIEFNF